jgi:hypothetical protein
LLEAHPDIGDIIGTRDCGKGSFGRHNQEGAAAGKEKASSHGHLILGVLMVSWPSDEAFFRRLFLFAAGSSG